MKRQAESQLTKDDDENSSDEGGERGMKKASDAELGRRAIRPLPSRNKLSAQPTIPSSASSGTSTFSAPNPFAGSAPAGSSLFSGFGAKSETGSSTSSTTNNAFSSSSPFGSLTSKPPAEPTSTAKAFTSLLSNSGSGLFGSAPSPAPAPVPKPSTSNTTSSPGKTTDESSTVTYYKNLRGLNVSFLSSISKFVQDDPYVDLAEAFEKYKSFRTKVQGDFDAAPATTKAAAQPQPPTPTPTAPPKSEKPAMPAPPSTFAGFGGFKASPFAGSTSGSSATPSSSDAASTGFKPSPSVFGSSSGSAFTLPAEPKSEPKSSGFTFGATSSSAAAAPPASASPFSFGSSSTTSSSPSPFGSFGAAATTDTKPASSAPSSAPSLFGSFGSSSGSASQPATSSLFGSTSTNKAGGFTFGKSDTTSPSNPFGVAEKPAGASSSFFSGAAAKPATGGSLFAFGSSSSSTSVFGNKPEPKVAAEENAATTTEGEGSERDTPAAEGETTTPGLMSANPLDEEGAGEEHEETVHAIKAKAFKLTKDAEGASKWLQLGTGILRLKKDKQSNARRVLLRNSTNGKVIVNFKIYAALKPTQNKSALSFIGHEDGAPVTYSIRTANENDAKNLKEALDSEIAAVSA